MTDLPRVVKPFVEFPTVLRAHGFVVSPDQTISFLEGIELLGPRSVEDIRRAAIALMAIPKDREPEFDALFRAFFLGQAVPGVVEGDDDEVAAHEGTGAEEDAEAPADDDEAGQEAAVAERLGRRDFAPEDADAARRRFVRMAPSLLPRRRSYRFAPDSSGKLLDMRRTLREAAKRDGEAFVLMRRSRRTRQRRIVLLIDVSGSMQARTDETLRLAHTVARTAERVEAFTLGTRLTRVTPALRLRNEAQALARVSALVADFDGGTRIGEALRAFLAVPRYAGFARGAAVIVISDGLERGGLETLIEAVSRLRRIAWRLDWLSPLAADPGYRPETGGLASILPDLDYLGDGANPAAVVDHLLDLARPA